MAQILVSGTETLLAGNHALMHNVYTIDTNSPIGALYVNGTGNLLVGATTITNISGNATGLSTASTLPNGTTATTQSANDNSTKVATTAYVNNVATGIPQVSGSQYFSPLYTSGTTINWNNGNVQYVALVSGTNAFTFTNGTSGGRYITILRQPSSGYGAGTWSSVQWPSGNIPLLTSATNNVDVLTFVYNNIDGTYYGGSNLGYTQ